MSYIADVGCLTTRDRLPDMDYVVIEYGDAYDNPGTVVVGPFPDTATAIRWVDCYPSDQEIEEMGVVGRDALLADYDEWEGRFYVNGWAFYPDDAEVTA